MMPRRRVSKLSLLKIDEHQSRSTNDYVVIEEPLEIRLQLSGAHGNSPEQSVSITMRTPGDDFELAAGFLFTEGILSCRDEIEQIRYCVGPDKEKQHFNIVSVSLSSGVQFNRERLHRHFYATSSCGVCGKASLEALAVQGCQPMPDGFQIATETILQLPGALRQEQFIFEKTGGLHAAALFTPDGRLACLREDVGRHNAVDKVIGAQFLQDKIPLYSSLLFVSGRAGFEIIQKALVARISVVAAVGAPSSLSVELAKEYNMTLLGFVRHNSFNVYCGAQRVLTPSMAQRHSFIR
jgi:FdhD protein